MAGNAENVGGDFLVKFGTLKVEATDASTNLNPVTITEQVTSDGVWTSSQNAASTASLTLIMTATTDKAALLAFKGDLKIFNRGTKKLECIHGAAITGGLDHDHKTGLATCSIIGGFGEVLKA